MTQKARCPMPPSNLVQNLSWAPWDRWIFDYQGARATFFYTFWIVPKINALMAPGSQVEHRGQIDLELTSENIKISNFGSASPYFWIAKIDNKMWGHSESNLREKTKRGLRERMIQCLPWAKWLRYLLYVLIKYVPVDLFLVCPVAFLKLFLW